MENVYTKSGALAKRIYFGATLIWEKAASFIIEVDTIKAGTPSNQFQFTGAEGDYDVVAKQGGAIVATFNDLSGQQTITLPSSGVYVLEIKAKEVNGFNRIAFLNGGDLDKITDIKQWGNIVWSSFHQSFRNCSNLVVSALDIPNLSICQNFSFMFSGARKVNPNVLNWDLTFATNMSLMLNVANLANPNARNWNIINVTNMDKIFYDSNLSVENLTACYENWSQLTLQMDVPFSAGTTKYNSSGQAGRDILINTYNWSITDGGQV